MAGKDEWVNAAAEEKEASEEESKAAEHQLQAADAQIDAAQAEAGAFRRENNVRSFGDLAKDFSDSAKKAYASGKQRASSPESWYRGGKRVASAGYSMIGRPHEGGMINLFVIIAFVFSYTFGKTGYSTATLSFYFMLGVLGWLLVFRQQAPVLSRESLQGLGKSMAIAAAAYLWPVILGKMSFLSPRVQLIIAGMFPVYVIWFVFVEPLTPFLQKLNKIYVISLVIILVAWGVVALSKGTLNIPGVGGVQYDTKAAFMEFKDLVWESSKVIWEKVVEFSRLTSKAFWDRIDYATGGALYAGQTDPDAEARLGVYIEKTQLSQREFYDDEPVGIWGVLRAETLDRDDHIDLNMRCFANYKNGSTPRNNNVSADSVIPLYASIGRKDRIDVDCLFNRRTLTAGSHTITLFVDFDFTTSAKQKVYFVDKERADALRRNDIDILEQYGITDKNPVAIYTNGPVMVGMDFREMPVRLSSEPNPVTLGMSIQNRWEGKVKGIKSMAIRMPRSMGILGSECSGFTFTRSDSGEQAVYTMDEPSKVREFDPYRTFRCPVEFNDVSEILGSVPVSTRFFEVEVKYYYQLAEDIPLRLINTTIPKKTDASGTNKSNKSTGQKGSVPVLDSFELGEASSGDDLTVQNGAKKLAMASLSGNYSRVYVIYKESDSKPDSGARQIAELAESASQKGTFKGEVALFDEGLYKIKAAYGSQEIIFDDYINVFFDESAPGGDGDGNGGGLSEPELVWFEIGDAISGEELNLYSEGAIETVTAEFEGNGIDAVSLVEPDGSEVLLGGSGGIYSARHSFTKSGDYRIKAEYGGKIKEYDDYISIYYEEP